MPRRSRRALLELLGTGTAALLAGCQADPSTDATERSSLTVSPTAVTTATASETESETATDSATETPESTECDVVSRPELAWPVPRRSPGRDSYVADPIGFESAPAFAWEAEASAPEDSYASPGYGRPVADRDRVYLVNLLDNGPQRPLHGHVHALDAESGDRQWTSDRFRSPSHPAVWGELVAVVAETESIDAMVVAFDRTDGTRQWTREFASRDSGFTIGGDHLYLASTESNGRGSLRALGADGSTVWRREGTFADHVNVGPTVGTDHVYVGTREGWLHALDRNEGTTSWSHRFEHPTEPQPYITDLVATTCSVVTVVEGVVNAIDIGGNHRWAVDGDHGSLSTDGEVVYAATGRGSDRELRSLELATGEVRWTVGGPLDTYAPPVLAGDDVIVRSDESIVALARADGDERWRTDRSLGDIALAGGTLYGTGGETLLALR